MVWLKLLGWLLILIGLFFVTGMMPTIRRYSTEGFNQSTILIGLIIGGIGIFLLVKS